MRLWVMDFLKVLPDPQILDDNDFVNILYEYAMNFDTERFRKAYADSRKKQAEKVSKDELRELGYSEEDIRNGKFD